MSERAVYLRYAVSSEGGEGDAVSTEGDAVSSESDARGDAVSSVEVMQSVYYTVGNLRDH